MQNSLKIEHWRATQYDPARPDHEYPGEKGEWFPAEVPGAIQYDLVSEGRLENPYAGTKAALGAAWVAKSDWLYRTDFETPGDAGTAGTVFLRFKGVDTYAEVWLNGVLLGETANAYRIYDFPVKPELLTSGGRNVLLVRVKAHERMIADKLYMAGRMGLPENEIEGRFGKALIRRYQRSFYGGSSLLNLGTGILGIGINREVELVIHQGAYFSDCFFRTLSLKDGNAQVLVTLDVENAAAGTVVKITLEDAAGKPVGGAEIPAHQKTVQLPLTIENPELWWPAGYGKPSLYTLKAEVAEAGKIIDQLIQKAGIRTSELVTKDEQGRKTFFLKVNDRCIIVHGENHVPLDYIKSYGSQKAYERIFDLLENQHVNLVRIWGGGVMEDDSFYAECDRRGIILFQELFLHSNVYPDWDADFVKEFLAESEGVLRQVRIHPCLCIVCGGNEQQQGWDEWGWKPSMDRFYGEKLIREELPGLSAEFCPDLPYIYNSPHGGKWSQSPVEGECHNWGNYYNSTKDPVFVTETCWTSESFSRPETLKKIMNLDVDEFTGLGWHKKFEERTGRTLVGFMPYSWWFAQEDLRSYMHGLEIEQLRADYTALSEFRFRSPSNRGIIYWSNNKGGPLFQFGCVDYDGYALMPYYAVKRVFAPIAVHAFRDMSDISVVLSNHGAEKIAVTVEASHLNKRGGILAHWSWDLAPEAGELLRVQWLENLYGHVRERTEESFYVSVTRDNTLAADDLLFFCPFSEFEGEYRPLKIKTEKNGEGRWRLYVEAETPVRLVELESNEKLLYTDNYFPLVPGKGKVVDLFLSGKEGEGPVCFTAGILGSRDKQIFELE